MTSTLAILRVAHRDGEPEAAIDHVMELGYDLARATVAADPRLRTMRRARFAIRAALELVQPRAKERTIGVDAVVDAARLATNPAGPGLFLINGGIVDSRSYRYTWETTSCVCVVDREARAPRMYVALKRSSGRTEPLGVSGSFRTASTERRAEIVAETLATARELADSLAIAEPRRRAFLVLPLWIFLVPPTDRDAWIPDSTPTATSRPTKGDR